MPARARWVGRARGIKVAGGASTVFTGLREDWSSLAVALIPKADSPRLGICGPGMNQWPTRTTIRAGNEAVGQLPTEL
jgi:hypothetical protein